MWHALDVEIFSAPKEHRRTHLGEQVRRNAQATFRNWQFAGHTLQFTLCFCTGPMPKLQVAILHRPIDTHLALHEHLSAFLNLGRLLNFAGGRQRRCDGCKKEQVNRAFVLFFGNSTQFCSGMESHF